MPINYGFLQCYFFLKLILDVDQSSARVCKHFLRRVVLKTLLLSDEANIYFLLQLQFTSKRKYELMLIAMYLSLYFTLTMYYTCTIRLEQFLI